MKKIALFFVLSCLTIFSFMLHFTVSAFEPIDYWYSTSNMIGRFTSSTISVRLYLEDDAMSSSDLATYYSFASGEWDDLIENDFSVITSGYPLIEFWSITRDSADSLYFPATAVGATSVSKATTPYARFTKLSGGTVSFYNLNYSIVMLIWDTDGTDGSVQTSNFSAGLWENIACHEMGHAIGHYGHSTEGMDNLMYSTTQPYTVYGINTPQYCDWKQIWLVYSPE